MFDPGAAPQALLGLRRGEACGLHWTDLDLDNAILGDLQLMEDGANGSSSVVRLVVCVSDVKQRRK